MENLLDKVLDPIINNLRERNGLRNFRGGNKSLTPYNVMLSMRTHVEQQDFALLQIFRPLIALLQARQALRDNGVGMARGSLLKFMKDYGKKGGYGAKVAESESLKKIWNTIVSVQDTGKSFSQDNIDDLKLNNPKLDKLEFVLREHFNRARSCGESSRAIVFSQWRDMVEEIVKMLQGSAPLVKAAKFVGQSSGSTAEDASSPTTKRATSSKVAGMNQKEQQKVIDEFRNGLHNVLICTCKCDTEKAFCASARIYY